jgi:hypothetical protein
MLSGRKKTFLCLPKRQDTDRAIYAGLVFLVIHVKKNVINKEPTH